MQKVTMPVFRKMPEPAEGERIMATDGQTVTMSNEQFQMLIDAATKASASTGLTAEELAKAFAREQRRENPRPPGVSVFNPKGERDHPRPQLKARTTQNGIKFDEDSLMWEEIEALNALPRGEFRVSKASGASIPFTVQHHIAIDGETLDRVEINYPCKGDDKNDHRSLLDYCLEVLDAVGKSEDSTRIRELKRELDALRKS